MKSTTLIFYGRDGDAAKALAVDVRKEQGAGAQIRSAVAFAGETEHCDRVLLLPCVTEFDAKRVATVYGERVARQGVAALPPLPPPPAADPLANLPPDWRTRDDVKTVAAAVAGRAVENKRQAIEVIEAELAKRAAK